MVCRPMPAPPPVPLRITYLSAENVRADLAQMAHGGVMVKDPRAADLALDASVALELALPDGVVLAASVKVLHVFPGVGAAVTVTPELVEQVRRSADGTAAEPGARPEPALARARGPIAAQDIGSLTHAEKIQVALHGNRDQRNAILRDTNRTLHAFVLKNPQVDTEDVAIRALDHIPLEALRQMAKGTGALPHVVQAARKKVLR